MSMNPIIEALNQEQMKTDVPVFSPGDTVVVQVRVKEGTRERLQAYEGVVIAIKNSGLNKTITVRKIMQGIGIERCFLIHSPKLDSIEILSSAKVRRSKLYYLRNLSGKATRLKQRFD